MDTLQQLKNAGAPIELWYVLVIALVGVMMLLLSILIYLVKRVFERMELTLNKLTDLVQAHDVDIELLKQAQPKRRQ